MSVVEIVKNVDMKEIVMINRLVMAEKVDLGSGRVIRGMVKVTGWNKKEKFRFKEREGTNKIKEIKG